MLHESSLAYGFFCSNLLDDQQRSHHSGSQAPRSVASLTGKTHGGESADALGGDMGAERGGSSQTKGAAR